MSKTPHETLDGDTWLMMSLSVMVRERVVRSLPSLGIGALGAICREVDITPPEEIDGPPLEVQVALRPVLLYPAALCAACYPPRSAALH